MNTSGFQVHFLSFSRNISVQFVWGWLDVAGDIVAIQWIPRATGATGMQIQYNYVTLYTKAMPGYVFPILCSDSIEVATSYQSRLLALS